MKKSGTWLTICVMNLGNLRNIRFYKKYRGHTTELNPFSGIMTEEKSDRRSLPVL